jgi:hypothetical protein
MHAKKSAFVLTALLSLSLPALAADWRPIAPEDLALKQSKTDPNADAECLFRDVRIENNVRGSIQNQTTNYLRFKIYNDRGREKYANASIEYNAKTSLGSVSARTIHPDGTIIDVKKDAIFNKVEVKKGGDKIKVITFAFPSVEPGSIIEYRWTENEGERLYRYIPLSVQTEYPVDEVTFHVKPATNYDYGIPAMRVMHFGCDPQQSKSDSMGFTSFTVRNVPAYKDEPFSPPGLTGKQWILIYYEENDKEEGDKYWSSVGRGYYAKAKEQIKVNGEMKQAAADITAPGKTDDEKLALLALYCMKNIKNLYGENVTTEERDAFKKDNASSIDTFKRKIGTPEDILIVFVALAQAAGYEARLAHVAARRNFIFDPRIHNGYFVYDNVDAAVQVGDKWKFYDISDEYAPPGTLSWPEQGVSALIPDSKNSEWVTTPLLSSDDSKIQRIADVTLSPEGDVDGTVRELFWGNEAMAWRTRHLHQNDSEREAYIRENLKERYADFEVKDIKVTISPDASRPVGVSYHLSVKGYCQRTGKRLFLRPSFFTAGHSAYFSDAERTNIIYFNYPWSEIDSVDIHLPPGFQLDHAEAPPSFEAPPIKWVAKVSLAPATNTLVYHRTFVVGTNTLIGFDPKFYKQVKAVFDQAHSSDEHMITLKQADPNSPAAPTGAPTQQR